MIVQVNLYFLAYYISQLILYNTEDIFQYISDWREKKDIVVSPFIIKLWYNKNIALQEFCQIHLKQAEFY